MKFKTFTINLTACNQWNYYGKYYAHNRTKPVSKGYRFFESHKDGTQRNTFKKVRGDRFNTPNMRYSDCHRVCRRHGDGKVI